MHSPASNTRQRTCGPDLNLAEVLPGSLAPFAGYAGELADEIQVPVGLLGPMMLSVASLSVLRAVEIQGRGGHTEVPALWTCTVGNPGDRKSAVAKTLARPVLHWQDRIRRDYDERRDDLDQFLGECEELLRSIKGKLAKPGLKPEERDALRVERVRTQQLIASNPNVDLPCLLADDATPEALAALLCVNHGRVGIITGEPAAFDQVLGRYGPSKPEIYLSAWSGETCRRMRLREGRPQVMVIRSPEMAIGAMAQPEVLRRMLASASTVGRGFVDRILLSAPPDYGPRRYQTGSQVSPHLDLLWHDRVQELCDLPRPGMIGVVDGKLTVQHPGPRVMDLSPDALEAYASLHDEIQRDVYSDTIWAQIPGWSAKAHGQCLRIAGVLQLLADPLAERIGIDCMNGAIAWTRYFAEHAAILLTQGDVIGMFDDLVGKALCILRDHDAEEISQRDLLQHLRGRGADRVHELEPVVDLLIDRGLVSLRRDPAGPKGGRPRTMLRIHQEHL